MSLRGFCLGLGAGAALGMLLAPRPGYKTRILLRNRAMDGASYIKRRTDEAREGAASLLKEATDKVACETEGVRAAVMAGKRAYVKATT